MRNIPTALIMNEAYLTTHNVPGHSDVMQLLTGIFVLSDAKLLLGEN
jgi:hypothetical protein